MTDTNDDRFLEYLPVNERVEIIAALKIIKTQLAVLDRHGFSISVDIGDLSTTAESTTKDETHG